MGTWGFTLYQNDTALDVKGEFEELFQTGKTAREITEKMTKDYESIMGDGEEETLFWLALADTQWNLGVLLPDVKEKALYWVDKDGGECQGQDPSAKAQWKKTMEDLKAKLLSPQPKPRKAVRKRVYRCQWKWWDIYAYPLESDLAREKGLFGRYFLIQKVDEDVWYPGHIVPIIYVKITNDHMLPSSVEEYDQLEYVQTGFTKYEERFWPIDMSRPQEDVAEKAKKDYLVDEYGFLPQYRLTLLNTSKKVIPPELVYVGNFGPATCPPNEFVPHVKANIGTVSWKQFDETFESKLIRLYCGHNRREFSIYKNGII